MTLRPTRLTKTQVGVEAVWGTAIAQTAVLPNLESLEIQPEVEISRQPKLGDLAEGTTHDIVEVGVSASMTERVTYGLLAFWLENIFGDATTAGADPYTHTHEVDTTAQPTRAGYTICKSDGTDEISLVGGLIAEYKITATPGEDVKGDISWIGARAEDGVLTGAQSDFADADQKLLPSELTVYLDALGSAGTTSLACDALSIELTLIPTTMIKPGLGTIGGCDFATTGLDVKLSLSAEAGNADVKTYIENLLGSTPTATNIDVQLSFSKSADYSWVVIVPMVLEKAPAWHSDADGILSFDLEFASVKNSTSSATESFFDSVVTNKDAVI